MTISSQRLNDETMEPDTNLGSNDLTKQIDAGKYQLSITSTQFSSIYPFKDAYWGIEHIIRQKLFLLMQKLH